MALKTDVIVGACIGGFFLLILAWWYWNRKPSRKNANPKSGQHELVGLNNEKDHIGHEIQNRMRQNSRDDTM